MRNLRPRTRPPVRPFGEQLEAVTELGVFRVVNFVPGLLIRPCRQYAEHEDELSGGHRGRLTHRAVHGIRVMHLA